jgi:hypothetical protein
MHNKSTTLSSKDLKELVHIQCLERCLAQGQVI